MYNLRQYWEQEESEALPVTVSDWCTKHHPSDWKDVHRDVQVGYSRFSHRQSGLLGLGLSPALQPTRALLGCLALEIEQKSCYHLTHPTLSVQGRYEVWICPIAIRGTASQLVRIMA